ncbi:MAG: UvrB/UvrC motif-containing protein, partial [Patescibacteria group bacterium]
ALDETDRRRAIQLEYNKVHGITPKTIEKAIRNILEEFGISADKAKNKSAKARRDRLATTTELDLIGDGRTINVIIKEKAEQMKQAAQELDFELAAILRDEIRELKAREKTTEVKELKKSKRQTISLPS